MFARAWDRALAKVAPTIEQAAFERAVLGWDEPVWHGGTIVGRRRRYSDSFVRPLLSRGGCDGGDDRDRQFAPADRATQAETDALLLANLRALKTRHEAEAARKALPAPDPAPTTAATRWENGDAGDADRGAAGVVRDGDGPRIWTPSR
ncbi:hypothetical protein QLH51_01900 [Sphingomonas sp. 2R-10]|uniref:hypothetical protein n=1 Tax=Sphingomonas sp. 2R-10 TaxID=3045148 RepID=UPI000F797845|nr:hypothetical protein [Sphingomonas sp. 2R-10]MDJ0275560.1 hypothetical protein [Sphingomonas sp. 2R-10]